MKQVFRRLKVNLQFDEDITINTLQVNNSEGVLVHNEQKQDEPTDTTTGPTIYLKEIVANNSKFKTNFGGTNINFSIGAFSLDEASIGDEYIFGNTMLENSDVYLSLSTDTTEATPDTTKGQPLLLTIESLLLNDNKLEFDNTDSIINKNEYNWGNVLYDRLEAGLRTIKITDSEYSLAIDSLKTLFPNGKTASLTARELKIATDSTSLKTFQLFFGETKIIGDFISSISLIGDKPFSKSDVWLALENSQVLTEDIAYFTGSEPLPVKGIYEINEKASLQNQKLAIAHLSFSIPEYGEYNAKGGVEQLFNNPRGQLSFTIKNKVEDIKGTKIPAFTADGDVILKDSLVSLKVISETSYGGLSVDGKYDLKTSEYIHATRLKGVDFTAYLPAEKIKNVNGDLNGQGNLNKEQHNIQVALACAYKQHKIRKLKGKVAYKRGEVVADLMVNTSFGKASVDGRYSLNKNTGKGKYKIDSLDLQKLGVVDSVLVVDATGEIDYADQENFLWSQTRFDIYSKDDKLAMKTNIKSSLNEGFIHVELGETMVDIETDTSLIRFYNTLANFEPDFNLEDFLQKKIRKQLVALPHFHIKTTTSELDLAFLNLGIDIIGELEVDIYNNAKGLEGTVEGKRLALENNYINSLSADVKADETLFDLKFITDVRNEYGYTKNVLQANLEGDDYKVVIESYKEEEDPVHKIALQGKALSLEALQISILELVINTKEWQINESDLVVGINGNFEGLIAMENGQQVIEIRPSVKRLTEGGRLLLDFKHFALSELGITSLTSGELSGQVRLIYKNPEIEVRTSLAVDNLKYDGFELGNYSMKIIASYDKDFYSDINILRNAAPLIVGEANYYQNDSIEANISINDFGLAPVSSFAEEWVSDLRGRLSTTITVEGTLKAPSIYGGLSIENFSCRVNETGAKYTSPKFKMEIEGYEFKLNEQKIYDQENGSLSVNGWYNPYDNVGDISLYSGNFLFTDKPYEKNSEWYGTLKAGVELSAKLSPASMVIDGDIVVHQSTDLVGVYNETFDVERNTEGITFSSRNNVDPVKEDTLDESADEYKYLVDGRIKIEEGTKLKYILDVATDQYVKVEGGGSLRYMINDLGISEVFGRFTVSGGTLLFDIPALGRKKMTIVEGSSVRWINELMDPQLDIVAKQTVRADASALLGNNTSSDYRNFEVLVKLKGTMNNMDINFDVVSNNRDVMNGIAALPPGQRTKEALSLLAFGTFSSDIMGGAGNQSTDYLLESFLNEVGSGDKDQKIKLNYSVNSQKSYDDEGNEVSEMVVAYSATTTFKDGKGTITYENNIGDRNNTQQVAAFGNITVEYKLDSAGNYRLKLFNEAEYDNIIDGSINKTGVGIRFHKQGRTFKDIWRKEETDGKVEEEK